MGSLGFAWKFGKGDQQMIEKDKTPEDNSNTVAALRTQVQQLQDENRKLQEQIDELRQLIANVVNSNKAAGQLIIWNVVCVNSNS